MFQKNYSLNWFIQYFQKIVSKVVYNNIIRTVRVPCGDGELLRDELLFYIEWCRFKTKINILKSGQNRKILKNEHRRK